MTRHDFHLILFVVLCSLGTNVIVADGPTGEVYLQEYAESSKLGFPDRARDVTVTHDDGSVYVLGDRGLWVRDGEDWRLLSERNLRLMASSDSDVYVSGEGAAFVWRRGRLKRLAQLPAFEGAPVRLAVARDLFVASMGGLYVRVGNTFLPARRLHRVAGEKRNFRWVATDSLRDRVAVAGMGGVYLFEDDDWKRIAPAGDSLHDVKAVEFGDEGELWFASKKRIGMYRRGEWTILGRVDGLPYDDFTTLCVADDGSPWFGTRKGAIRYDDGVWEYRQGRRWLPGDHVLASASSNDRSSWFVTDRGLGRIARRGMSLREKAEIFEKAIDQHHRRTKFGYVDAAYLSAPGDITRSALAPSDNDGLWTSMYGAGECFAWGAFSDPKAKARAHAAFRALRFLGTVTENSVPRARPGFVARTVLESSKRDPNEGRAAVDRKIRASRDRRWKLLDPRWPKSADGEWFWKADTSSDELDGHYFFYGVYFDLVCSTEEEKDAVRTVVRKITDHLIENDFCLIDHDGKPTRWAVFGPKQLNHDPLWWEERGLNSLSILSYLKVAEHITGDMKYRGAARKLIDEHGYAMNVLHPKAQRGPGSGNQSDDEMAFMAYYGLLRYERDQDLRRIYALSFRRYWDLERPERNPLFNYLFAASMRDGESWTDAFETRSLAADGEWREESLDTLRRYPLDRIDWAVENSHRNDVRLLPSHARESKGAKFGHLVDGRVLPIDERVVDHWNHDPWRLDQGGSGLRLFDGASFLLPYYLGRYHGFIE